MNQKDKTGQRFGNLLVTARFYESGLETRYGCECDCGKRCVVGSRSLVKGKTHCGCVPRTWRTSSDETLKINMMWANYRDKAKRRNFAWALTKGQFSELVLGLCHYCKTPSSTGFVGVDRKDSSKGYEYANCVSACSQCNFAKSDTPYIEFLEWIKRVYVGLLVQ